MSNFFITFAAPHDLESDDGENATEPPVRGAKRHRGTGEGVEVSADSTPSRGSATFSLQPCPARS
jgi:hypothetical protein